MLHNSKKSKKYLLTAWLLTAVMLLQLVPALSVFATETAKSGTDGNINWAISDGVLTVSGNGDMPNYSSSFTNSAPWKDLSFTTAIVEEGITSIGDSAFSHCTGLTSITLPDSLTYIGIAAFHDCTGLTSITLPDSITSIGYNAFSYCTGLTSITLPDGITSIGDNAFSYCTGLTSITLPDGITSIGNTAFSNCYGLTSITLPDSITSIGYKAFYYCNGLTSITLPASLSSIGENAFYKCSGLKKVYYDGSEADWIEIDCDSGNYLLDANIIFLPALATSGVDENISWSVTDGVLTISGNGDMPNYTDYSFTNSAPWQDLSFTTAIVEEGITTIGDDAFYHCAGLTSITLPDGITSIGDGAFSSCDGLTSITLPDGITSIGNTAFFSCNSLTSITLPDSITSIGDGAFRYCSGLTSITLPDSITSIGNAAFRGCTGLTTVYYYGTEAEWSKINVEKENDILLNVEIICSYIDEESKAPISNNPNIIFNDKSVATNTALIVICVTISLLAVVGIAILVFIKVKKSK